MIAVNHIFRPESLVRDFHFCIGLFGDFGRNFREFASPFRRRGSTRTLLFLAVAVVVAIVVVGIVFVHHQIVHLSKGTLSQQSTDCVVSR